MKRVFGLETEHGITVENAEAVDVVAESGPRRKSRPLFLCRAPVRHKTAPAHRWQNTLTQPRKLDLLLRKHPVEI